MSQDEGLAPQILTSDLVQKQAVASPVLEVTFVLADDDKIVEVLFDGKIEPIKPGTLVMVTKKLHMKEGNNLVEVAAVDEEGHVRKKTFYLYYGGDEMLAGGQGNWLMWATLSVAMGGLMMSESQAVAKLNAKQHDLLAQMAAAGTAAQYNTLNSQLTDTYHQAKEHWNVGAAAMTLSLVFLGTAVYEWANLPESTEPKDQVLFLAPSQDRLTLVYQARF
ncbi:MAG: hypothetical protein OEV94_04025 [Deltaproteobacteria bacterium]|nr:hypothetical protein [Deltaproteobacteria bacterium]